jgi:hypothetical protein
MRQIPLRRPGDPTTRWPAVRCKGRTLRVALAPNLPPRVTTGIVPGVARGGHVDQAWVFAVANRDALMNNQDAIGRNRAFPGIVSSSSKPAHADMMEAYVREHFGADALGEAQRVGNGIRIRAGAEGAPAAAGAGRTEQSHPKGTT